MTDIINIVTDVEQLFWNKNFFDLPKVSLYAVGGFPITVRDGKASLMGNNITAGSLRANINQALGLSAVFTYSNKSELAIEQLGNMCKELGHFWGYNFITLSFLFANVDAAVELSLLRNNTFYESWVVKGYKGVFGMTGSLKDFKKFVSNKDDKSFDAPTREIMTLIDETYSFLWKQKITCL